MNGKRCRPGAWAESLLDQQFGNRANQRSTKWEEQIEEGTIAIGRCAALALSAGSAMAQKKQLVIVVKGLDNPFFEAIHQGCEKWNKENASSPYNCFYTGPASTSDEAGEAQIVQDMLGKSDTVGHGDLAIQRAVDRQLDQGPPSQKFRS